MGSNQCCRLLIEAPRRTPAIPNDDGTHAIYTVSTYDLKTHSETREVKILDLETGSSTLFSDDARNGGAKWLIGDSILWQREGEGGKTDLWIGHAVGDKKYVVSEIVNLPAFFSLFSP